MPNDPEIGRYLSKIHRLQFKYLKPLFDGLPLPPSCFALIKQIGREPGISQKELSKMTHIDEALATRLVKQLKAAQIITKDRNPQDQRAFQLYLTEKGYALLPKIQAALDQWWQILLEDLPIEQLSTYLQIITTRAEALANQEKENYHE